MALPGVLAIEFRPQVPSGLAGGAALLLIVGGLCILAIMILFQIVESVLPVRPGPLPAGKGSRRLRPSVAPQGVPTIAPSSVPAPANPPKGAPAPPVESALLALVAQGEGEPRILRFRPGSLTIRLYHCLECRFLPRTRVPDALAGCSSEVEILQTALQLAYGPQVRVHEATCRQRGELDCEFEVTH